MRIAYLLTILYSIISSVIAYDPLSTRHRCTAYASTKEVWQKDGMQRRRVVYETSRIITRYDQAMMVLGRSWADEKISMFFFSCFFSAIS